MSRVKVTTVMPKGACGPQLERGPLGGAIATLARRGGFIMAGAKLIVLYPSPRDVNAFERAYTQDHAPMVTPQTFKGLGSS